ncbi:unnamed protein product [Adineta ricciae]|uniref:Uncharacterized protein n=1 Tax=Adineta ricciae TaxID=249248 RepID=A0A813SU57_ADIRI|nr:unnamed protein product [Adineta ricciae]
MNIDFRRFTVQQQRTVQPDLLANFRKESVDRHNLKRSEHCVQESELDQSLNDQAQQLTADDELHLIMILVQCGLYISKKSDQNLDGIICSDPDSYEGQSLCDFWGKFMLSDYYILCTSFIGGECGQCVSFIKICTGDRRQTKEWKKGQKVRGADIAYGTAIATFPNGKYYGHAAIYLGQNQAGIQVYDQWRKHPVSRRTIRWNGSGISNNGNSFYVVD